MAKKETTSAKAASPDNKSKKKKNNRNPWFIFKDGRSMSLTFFRRNGWLILIVVVAAVWLTSQRYSNQTRMEKIKGLEEELTKAESQMLDAKSEYMGMIRETKMIELMKEKKLDLQYKEAPPYIITK